MNVSVHPYPGLFGRSLRIVECSAVLHADGSEIFNLSVLCEEAPGSTMGSPRRRRATEEDFAQSEDKLPLADHSTCNL